MRFNIDADPLDADWIKTLHWDLPTDPDDFLATIGGRDKLAAFMRRPAAQAMPASLRSALGATKRDVSDEARDEAGKWTGDGAALEVKEYAGETGNRDHITRTEQGTIPTSVIARMRGERGEVPGAHRNMQGDRWQSFKDDIRANGIKSPIFILVDPGKPPVISEGNHRRDAAVELGMERVPVEIRYFGHSEQSGTVTQRAG